MTKLFKCDRCGEIDQTTDKAFGYLSNLSETIDLCGTCTNEIWIYAVSANDDNKGSRQLTA